METGTLCVTWEEIGLYVLGFPVFEGHDTMGVAFTNVACLPSKSAHCITRNVS